MAGLFGGVALMAIKKSQTWRAIALFTLFIGIGWEVLEIVTRAVDVTIWWYPLDTMKDIINDLIGGTIAYFIWRKL